MKMFNFDLSSLFGKRNRDNEEDDIIYKTVMLTGSEDVSWKEEIKHNLQICNITFTSNNTMQLLRNKGKYDFYVFVITPNPNSTLIDSIAYVIDLSNKYPEKVIFCTLDNYDNCEFTNDQWETLINLGNIVEDNGGMFVHSLCEIEEYILGYMRSIYVTKLSFRNVDGKPIDKFIGLCKESKLEVAKKIIKTHMIQSYYGKIIPIHEFPAYNSGLCLEDVSASQMAGYGIEVVSSIDDYLDHPDVKSCRWRYKSLNQTACLNEAIKHIDALVENDIGNVEIYKRIRSDFIELRQCFK